MTYASCVRLQAEQRGGVLVDAAPPTARRLVVASTVAMAGALVAGVTVTGAGPHAGDRTNPDAIDRLHVSIPLLTSVHALLVVIFLSLLLAAFAANKLGAVRLGGIFKGAAASAATSCCASPTPEFRA